MVGSWSRITDRNFSGVSLRRLTENSAFSPQLVDSASIKMAASGTAWCLRKISAIIADSGRASVDTSP